MHDMITTLNIKSNPSNLKKIFKFCCDSGLFQETVNHNAFKFSIRTYKNICMTLINFACLIKIFGFLGTVKHFTEKKMTIYSNV